MTDTDPETPSFKVRKILYLSPQYVRVTAESIHRPVGVTTTAEYIVPTARAPRVGDLVFLVTP